MLDQTDDILTPENVANYILENGANRVKGYQDALSDILKSIDSIIFKPSHGDNVYLNSPNRVRTELREFYQQQSHLLNSLNAYLSNESLADSSNLLPDSKVIPEKKIL